VTKFHERPEYFDSALAYMSAEITAQAVERAGLDHDRLRQDISTQTFDTINGPVRFTGVENVTTPTMLMQLQDGEAQTSGRGRRHRRRSSPRALGWTKSYMGLTC
jgi:branched-chain amino acid transport system substrate-binding protein